jgi:hypothetical protein
LENQQVRDFAIFSLRFGAERWWLKMLFKNKNVFFAIKIILNKEKINKDENSKPLTESAQA